jgi:hypothetical protein
MTAGEDIKVAIDRLIRRAAAPDGETVYAASVKYGKQTIGWTIWQGTGSGPAAAGGRYRGFSAILISLRAFPPSSFALTSGANAELSMLACIFSKLPIWWG